MSVLEALQLEGASDVRDGKQTVTFTEDGQVCYDAGQGNDDPGVLCRVEALPESVRWKLTQGHKMALDAMILLVAAMQEAQTQGYGPDDSLAG